MLKGLTAIAASALLVITPTGPSDAGDLDVVAELSFSPTTVAPGGTVAISGRCLGYDDEPTPDAGVRAYFYPDGPANPSESMQVSFAPGADGRFSGGFIVPSDATTTDWSFILQCHDGDILYGNSEPAVLTVAGAPAGPFSMALAVAPAAILPGEAIEVSGRCLNDGLPLNTARVVVPNAWPDLTTELLVAEVPVDADGAFRTTLTYPTDGPIGPRDVRLHCFSGPDVVARTVTAPLTVNEPAAPPSSPPAAPVPGEVAYTG